LWRAAWCALVFFRRSLQHLIGFLSELHALGIDLMLHQQGLDTTTPAGKAMFQMMGVFAEFERAMIRERVKAGFERARAQGRVVLTKSAGRSDDAHPKHELPQRTRRFPGRPTASAPDRPGSPAPFATALSKSTSPRLHLRLIIQSLAAMLPSPSAPSCESEARVQVIMDHMNPAQMISSKESMN
jgi:hypothetical protein